MVDPHANEWAITESGNIVRNNSPAPSLDLNDWCLVTVFSDHSTSAFKVGVQPKIVSRRGAAVRVVDVAGPEGGGGGGGGGGGMVETRVEQNCEILGVCWQLDSEAWCFVLCICDSTAFTPIVPSLKHFLHKMHRASYTLPGTAFSHLEKCWSDSQFSLNLHFPIAKRVARLLPGCYHGCYRCSRVAP